MTPNQSPQTNVNRNIRLPHPSQHLLSQIILMLSHQDITIYQRINFIFLLSQKSQSNGLECGMSKIWLKQIYFLRFGATHLIITLFNIFTNSSQLRCYKVRSTEPEKREGINIFVAIYYKNKQRCNRNIPFSRVPQYHVQRNWENQRLNLVH